MTEHPGTGRPRAAAERVDRASELFRQAGMVVGDRLAEQRFDPDRGLRVTVIDLDDSDVAAIDGIARRLGIDDGWVRIEGADPSDLQNWERLRLDLTELHTAGGILTLFPGPDAGYQRPPVRIMMSAAGEDAAAGLHAAYGSFVSLTVGALPYPPAPQPQRSGRADEPERPLVNPAEMTVALDGPVSVRSGQKTTHGLLVTNLGDKDLGILNNGWAHANILDPVTRVTVGGRGSGASTTALRLLRAAPGETVRIPLFIGTASYVPELGYRIPAGQWLLSVPLDLGTFHHRAGHVSSPAFPLTITD